ncbi:hypothetical protein ACC703_38670, partial [Rhizobium ruizarguesonis]
STLSTIHVEDSPRAHRVIVEIGTLLPFHATASGLAYLAFSDKKYIESALSQPLDAFPTVLMRSPLFVRSPFDTGWCYGHLSGSSSSMSG